MPEIKIKGKSYNTRIGSRAEVWHGNAFKTSGGLTKSHLMKNKSGRIVSKAKHETAKKDNRLVKAGYGSQKGKFGFVLLNKTGKRHHKGKRSAKRGRKAIRGGSGVNYALNPSPYDGEGVGTSGVALQFVAGNAA
jgi:hypothetical protein